VRKLVAALACRAGGSRLYGKPLQFLDIEKKLSVLEYMVQSLQTEPAISEIVLGVSVGSENEPFHDMAKRLGLKSIRGDEIDVLSRLIQCGDAGNATDVFRVTTESPFVYFETISEAWRLHQANANDVTHMSGLPAGCGFEMIRLESLKMAHARGEARHRSELCTLYVKEHRDEFQVQVLEPTPECARLDLRLTIDYPEDLVLCRRVYDHLKELAPRIPVSRIVEFLDANPETRKLVEPYSAGIRWYGETK